MESILAIEANGAKSLTNPFTLNTTGTTGSCEVESLYRGDPGVSRWVRGGSEKQMSS